MKKITLAVPALAAVLLATSACAKKDVVANNTSFSAVNSTDEITTDGNGVDANAAGADPFANDASEPANAAAPIGNAE